MTMNTKDLNTMKFLQGEGMDTEPLNIVKLTDRIMTSRTSTGFDVDVKSENYDLMKELYNEKQEENAYSYTIKLVKVVI